MKARIINMEETCLSLDGSNGNWGRCPTVTYYDVHFPQLGKAMPKLALTTTVFSRSNVAGKPIAPHFPFQHNLYPVSLAHAYGPFLVLSSGPKTYQEVGYTIYHSQKTPSMRQFKTWWWIGNRWIKWGILPHYIVITITWTKANWQWQWTSWFLNAVSRKALFDPCAPRVCAVFSLIRAPLSNFYI